MTTKELPAQKGAELLEVNRTSIYYKGTPISEENLACKSIIDRIHTDNPAWGARQMSSQLKSLGYLVGRRKARRYMTEMGIDAIYPKMNLSKRMQQAKVCPYLLRNAVISRPNQAWSIDITYIPIKRGFLYLTAVIDWYSRCIVGWEVDDTLDTRMVIHALGKAFIPVRKKGKLPLETVEESYDLEYGSATIEMHKDSIKPGQKVVIIDDLIATGGTVEACAKMIERLGGEVTRIVFLMELAGLKGREKLAKYDVKSVIRYDGK